MSQPSRKSKVKAAPILPQKSAWVMGALAFCFLLAGLAGMLRAFASRAQWIPEEVAIGHAEVVSFGDKDAPRYRIQVEFDYTVRGERYVVPHSMPVTYSSRDAAMEDTLRYSTGSRHRIFYHVSRPYEILLDRGSASRFYPVSLLLTALGAVLGAGVVLTYLRGSRYSCPSCGAGVDARHAFCFHCGRRIPKRKGKMIA